MKRKNKTGAAALSIASNALLITLKIIVGILSGSVSIISDAIHSTLDLVAAVIAFISVHISDNPPDKNHPYGHGKIENVSGVVEALLILVAAGCRRLGTFTDPEGDSDLHLARLDPLERRTGPGD